MKSRLFVVVSFVSSLRAQTPTATVTGIVTDQSGGTINTAKVSVRNTGTNVTHEVLTNKDGAYTIPLLDIGQYEITVEAVGFEKEVRTGITLQVGETAKLYSMMTLGQVTDTVRVTSEAPTTETDTASVGTVVDNKHLVEMPVNGRQFYSLATLVPGVTPPVQNSTLSFRGGFNVAGASEVANNFTLNGFNNNNQDVSAPNFRPSLDVIQEFNVLTGVYPAEFGCGRAGRYRSRRSRARTNIMGQPAAFATPAAGTFGNAGRNIINGPGMVNLDASVVHTFQIKEQFGVQFRAQAYNTLNHANFNFPNATMDSSARGTISSALDPRTLEAALRVIF